MNNFNYKILMDSTSPEYLQFQSIKNFIKVINITTNKFKIFIKLI